MRTPIQIGERKLGPGNPVYIIAEIGVNHGGDMNLAREMVKAAKEAGADAVKFQTYCTDSLTTAITPKVEYQKRTTSGDDKQMQMLRALEFKKQDHYGIIEYCAQLEIDFLSTPYDIESAQFLDSLGVVAFKTASADIVDLPLHQELARTGRPVIIATGMATLDEISECISVYKAEGNDQLILLHCVSNYPASDASLNLRCMQTLGQVFKTLIGYSDHSIGSRAAMIAVALSGCVVEKHFTTDKTLPGPDHQASSTPQEFRELVDAIRHAELVLGSAEKICQAEELQMRSFSRKSIVLKRPIERGTTLSLKDLCMKRPGTGLKAVELKNVVGRKLKFDLPADHLLSFEDLTD